MSTTYPNTAVVASAQSDGTVRLDINNGGTPLATITMHADVAEVLVMDLQQAIRDIHKRPA